MGAPFRIGDRVISLADHPTGSFKKGQEFTVRDMRKGCCSWEVDVGIKSDADALECLRCGHIEVHTGVSWKRYDYFAPLLATFSRMTFKEVINEVVTCEN